MEPTSEAVDFAALAAHVKKAGSGRLLVGIDGPGAAGKSTFAEHLGRSLGDAQVVHGDDFYRPSSQRPSGEFEPGGQFDLDRLLAQVIEPAAAGLPVRYQRYDWDNDRLADWIEVPEGVHIIVEGIYTTEARLRDRYDFRVFCTAGFETRLARGLARDGEAARSQWVDEWMPAEDRYFEAQDPRTRAELVVDGGGDDSGHPVFQITNHR